MAPRSGYWSQGTDVSSLPRVWEPLETELRGNDFVQQMSLKVDFPGGIPQGPWNVDIKEKNQSSFKSSPWWLNCCCQTFFFLSSPYMWPFSFSHVHIFPLSSLKCGVSWFWSETKIHCFKYITRCQSPTSKLCISSKGKRPWSVYWERGTAFCWVPAMCQALLPGWPELIATLRQVCPCGFNGLTSQVRTPHSEPEVTFLMSNMVCRWWCRTPLETLLFFLLSTKPGNEHPKWNRHPNWASWDSLLTLATKRLNYLGNHLLNNLGAAECHFFIQDVLRAASTLSAVLGTKGRDEQDRNNPFFLEVTVWYRNRNYL